MGRKNKKSTFIVLRVYVFINVFSGSMLRQILHTGPLMQSHNNKETKPDGAVSRLQGLHLLAGYRKYVYI